jgi:hypothetical protein
MGGRHSVPSSSGSADVDSDVHSNPSHPTNIFTERVDAYMPFCRSLELDFRYSFISWFRI